MIAIGESGEGWKQWWRVCFMEVKFHLGEKKIQCAIKAVKNEM